MESSDMFNALHFKHLNDENLQKQVKKVDKLNREIIKIMQDSFKNGFDAGENNSRTSERLSVRGKVVGNLFINTTMTDDEIYEIVGFGEESWKEHIKYLRKQYEVGLRIGKTKVLISEIIEKFGDTSEDIKLEFEKVDYDFLRENFEKSISLEELVSRIKK